MSQPARLRPDTRPTIHRQLGRRAFAAISALGCAAVLSLAACTTTDPGRTDQSADEVRLVLDWTPNTNHTGIYVAQEKGYYAEADLEVTVLPPSQAGVQNVLANDGADIGISGATGVIQATARGEDLLMVLNLQQRSSAGIAVQAGREDLQRPRDLDGKLFASWGASEALAGVREMIRSDGGTGEFEQVTLGTSAYEALYAGQADFAQGLSTWEGIEAELRGTPLRFFFPADYGVTVTPAEIGFAVRTAYAEEHEDVVERFVEATQRGYAFALEDPDEAADILVEANPEIALDPELTLASQRLLSGEYWPDATGGIGHADLDAWQAYLDHLVDAELLTDEDGSTAVLAPRVDDVVTNRFLP